MEPQLQRRTALQCELVTDLARTFGEVRLKVTGASMLPAVWPGDILTVRRQTVKELEAGQIVLCFREGQFVAHRVVRAGSDRLVTRGDSLPREDRPFAAEDLVGQVVGILRNGRRVRTEQSFWQRATSEVLRRSDPCARMLLRLGRGLRRARATEISWAN